MANQCSICGSTERRTKFIKEGTTVDTSWEIGKGTPDEEFLRYIEYDFYYTVVAKKDYKYVCCKECDYCWREEVKVSGNDIPFPEKFNMSANDMLKYENIMEDVGSLLDTMASTLNDDEYELFRTEFMSKLKEI